MLTVPKKMNLDFFQAPRPDNTVVLVLSRSRSVTPHGEGAYDRTDYPSYNYLNSGRPPKILESPLDSKSLLSGKYFGLLQFEVTGFFDEMTAFCCRFEVC